jgi:hypothetical protein
MRSDRHLCLPDDNRHPHRLRRPSFHCALLSDALQQAGDRVATGVRREAHHAGRAGVNVDAVRLHENGIASGNVE